MVFASLLRLADGNASEARQPRLSLEEIYRDHFDYVFRQAARLGGPGFDAEDAAQEVFLVAARKLDSFDGAAQITTWLYAITFNIVRSQRRNARVRRIFALSASEDETAVRSLDRAEVLDAHRIAYEILDALGEKKREAFILAEFEGLSCDEIARRVGAKTETIWSRLHYARKEFSERLAARMQPKPTL
jgi:RNA polymerase sigma-70 factor (ECF subfamily)